MQVKIITAVHGHILIIWGTPSSNQTMSKFDTVVASKYKWTILSCFHMKLWRIQKQIKWKRGYVHRHVFIYWAETENLIYPLFLIHTWCYNFFQLWVAPTRHHVPQIHHKKPYYSYSDRNLKISLWVLIIWGTWTFFGFFVFVKFDHQNNRRKAFFTHGV